MLFRSYKAYLTSGYHFIGLNLVSPVLGLPWHFPMATLAENPFIWPIGTQKSEVDINWRCLPFFQPRTVTAIGGGGSTLMPGEILSSGAVLWDRVLDT